MSTPAPTPSVPARGPSTERMFLTALLALVVAVGGCSALRQVAASRGYGADLQLAPAAAAGFLLFVGFTVALWPGVRWRSRVVAVTVGVALAAAAWAFVPGERGLSLAGAVAKRDALLARADAVPLGDEETLLDLRRQLTDLANTFPSLSKSTETEFDRRADAGASETVGRI